jgi:hypothetical protein
MSRIPKKPHDRCRRTRAAAIIGFEEGAALHD